MSQDREKKADGRSPAQRKAMRSLAMAVQAGLPVEFMVEWHLLILEGKSPRLVRNEDKEVVGVTAEEHGMTPTLEQRTRSLIELTNRGHGMPAQKHQIEGELRAIGAIAHLQLGGKMSPAQMQAFKRVMRGQLVAPADPTPEAPAASDAEPDAEDAEFSEQRISESAEFTEVDEQPAPAG